MVTIQFLVNIYPHCNKPSTADTLVLYIGDLEGGLPWDQVHRKKKGKGDCGGGGGGEKLAPALTGGLRVSPRIFNLYQRILHTPICPYKIQPTVSLYCHYHCHKMQHLRMFYILTLKCNSLKVYRCNRENTFLFPSHVPLCILVIDGSITALYSYYCAVGLPVKW